MSCLKPKRNHLQLGRRFFSRTRPAQFPEQTIRYQQLGWAQRLGLGHLAADDSQWCAHFADFKPINGSLKAPLALHYHGHQFGSYNPQLGDGRGFLYAQLEDPLDGRLLDLGTKGSGTTPFSRGADGRLTLKGAVREILATEMLEALGVNTSKTFSVIETGEALERHDEPSPTRAAVLVRLSHGHIRIGSFQRLAYLDDRVGLEKLLRYAAVTYPDPALADAATLPVAALAEAFIATVASRLAHLTANWMAAGFVHGVLNTDNYNISGESFDYGPWRFLHQLDPGFTAAYFDQLGRYAFGRQPEAGFWAVCRLADCFTALVAMESLERAVLQFSHTMERAVIVSVCRRLGIDPDWPDAALMTEQLMMAIRNSGIGYESVFFDWYGGAVRADQAMQGPQRAEYTTAVFRKAVDMLHNAPMAAAATPHHRYFCRQSPCTMLIEQVEAIWKPIAERDDWTVLEAKLAEIHLMAEAYAATKPVSQARLGGISAKSV